MNRKLLPKTLKPYAMFLAGLVSGVGLVLWWGGRKDDTPTFYEWTDGWIANVDGTLKQVGNAGFILRNPHDRLADKSYSGNNKLQVDRAKAEIKNMESDMKILGVWDRVLTDKELQRIHEMSVEEIEDSFDITQEIKVK